MPAISADYLTNGKRRLRALIVGINDYSGAQLLSGAAPVVQSLRGAIPDAEAMHDYLRGHYPSDIRTLYDSQATRENIIEGIKALANGDFNRGDPIVIFFAGHGARAFSPKDGGWPRSTDGFIEGIVPYDYGRGETSFIPDRTLAALLDNLAKTAAGEDRDSDPNITIIFDCCHSGSAARTSEVDETILERGFDIASPVPSDLDKDIWDPIEKERPRVFKPTPGFKHAGARSHVLLAACAEHELARETAGRGVFTTALLKILERPDARELTYKEIMNSLPAMLQQTPQVVGVNSNRLLFSGTRSSRHGYLIRRDDGEQFKLKAGAMHGVGLKTQFSVWRTQSDKEPVGTFTVIKVQPDHCLGTIDFSSETPADADAFSALIVNREAKETLKLFISGLDDDLAFAVRDAIQNITETAGTGLFEVYEHEVGAHMKISGKEGKLTFEYAEELFKSFHELGCPRIDPFDVDLVRNALDGAQRFLWHLNRSPGDAMGSKGIFQVCEVKVQMFELEDTGRYTVSPKFEVPVLGRKAYIELERGEDSPPYGMAITNNSPIDLYASVFYFDCNDLSIQCYSSTPNQGASVQPHLRAGKTLTIGYDSPDQGGIPFSYYLSGKNDVEVGFIKIFLSNVASDLSVIEQYSPFSPDYRGAKPYVAKTISVWDEMTIAVEQRLKETV